MTKHEYSVEEVRDMAAEISDYGGTQAGLMLNSYADLLEQIERAKDGVTDEVAALVAQAFQDSQVQLSVPRLGIHVMNWADCSPEWQAEHTRRMHTALQAVAHLLPSGESGGVRVRCQHCGTIFTKRDWIAYNFHRPIPRCPFCGASGEPKPARADALETFIHPPAQAAQVDADGLIDAYDEATRRQRNSGFLPEAAQRAAVDCVEHNRNRLRKAILTAPTADPVARGEASVYGTREKEAVELAGILDGLHEGGYDLENLYVTDPADGDCFVARAADLLREFAAQPRVVPDIKNTRCPAHVVHPKPAPPGPGNPPLWCCLPKGHDGPHRHDGGGEYPSIPFRDTDEVSMLTAAPLLGESL